MKMHGVPMFAHCVIRNGAEQDALYVQNRSKARAGQSPHNYGMAIDIVHGRKAWELPGTSWSIIGHIGKEIAHQRGLKLEWGGDWSFYDPAHWQLENWRSLAGGYPFRGVW